MRHAISIDRNHECAIFIIVGSAESCSSRETTITATATWDIVQRASMSCATFVFCTVLMLMRLLKSMNLLWLPFFAFLSFLRSFIEGFSSNEKEKESWKKIEDWGKNASCLWEAYRMHDTIRWCDEGIGKSRISLTSFDKLFSLDYSGSELWSESN